MQCPANIRRNILDAKLRVEREMNQLASDF